MQPANRAESVALLTERVKLAPEVAQAAYDLMREPKFGLAPDAHFDIEGFRNLLAIRAEMEGQWAASRRRRASTSISSITSAPSSRLRDDRGWRLETRTGFITSKTAEKSVPESGYETTSRDRTLQLVSRTNHSRTSTPINTIGKYIQADPDFLAYRVSTKISEFGWGSYPCSSVFICGSKRLFLRLLLVYLVHSLESPVTSAFAGSPGSPRYCLARLRPWRRILS
jgi:hypothetical protein